jgi:hypothetical protein
VTGSQSVTFHDHIHGQNIMKNLKYGFDIDVKITKFLRYFSV